VGPDTLADITGQGAFLYRQIHEAVRSATEPDFSLANMATGLTALYIAERNLFFAHVGHGRAYLFRDGELTQLTEDQTIRRRPTDPSRHETRDFKHVVTETIGGERREPAVDMEHVTLASGDRLLLCTNGLTDVVEDDQIADTLALQRRPADDCQHLIELAHSQGSPDDVTVLIADYSVRPNPASPDESS
jgi:protein phosphatase